MRRFIQHLLLAEMFAFPVASYAVDFKSAEQLAAAHVEALGGIDKIHAIHGYISHGTYNEGDLHINTYVAQQRPFYRVIGDPAKGLTSIHEGYDGSAWEYYPDPGIAVRTVGPAAAAARHTALFDDPLVEPAVYGIKLELEAPAKLHDMEVYVVRATLPDGEQRDIYVNEKTLMIDAYVHVVPFHAFGERAPTLLEFGDYRPEGGVLRPHTDRETNLTTGQVLTYGTLESVEINPTFPRGAFSPPAWERTALQEMIQRIYDERDEAVSVMTTYADFRRMPQMAGVDTANAVDFVAYQCLKMGHVDTAVALTEANVRDNPASARAHFGHGRTLREAKRMDEAQMEFKEALRIDPKFLAARTALDAVR